MPASMTGILHLAAELDTNTMPVKLCIFLKTKCHFHTYEFTVSFMYFLLPLTIIG
jgi:hypothetical protein